MAYTELYEPVITAQEAPQDPRIDALIRWAARLAALGLTPSYGPGDHGNLSCRTTRGCLISARQTAKAGMLATQFVEVYNPESLLAADAVQTGVRLSCRGLLLPSTDALMHLEIYRRRPEIQAILHGHDTAALARAETLGLPMTQQSAATRSPVDEICALARDHDYLLLREHGFLSLGRSIDEAGERFESIYRQARPASDRGDRV